MANVNLIYFSPSMSTKNVVQKIGKAIGWDIASEHDITIGSAATLTFTPNDLVVIGVPVYSGRVPSTAAAILSKVKGQHTPAVIVCVYGNRDYDDALLELRDICTKNQLNVIAAGAFIACHSIFPKVAEGRPDEADLRKIKEFGERCAIEYQNAINFSKPVDLTIKGKYPYREVKKIPLTPKAARRCNKCNTCVKHCPVGAISIENPKRTNKALCIACTRCITVCPEKVRRFGGLIYRIARKKFGSAYATRKEPELFFPS